MDFFTFKQEVHHFLLQQFAVLRIHHVEFFFIDQHGLFGLPLCPSFFADVVENAFAQFAGIELEI
ncbi:Uncharacterised protein [Vibrio cholerae]|uniref:Uncharacterized protein n=1 Tax=Vibrio cholerae TaxID=666 RepID=A0A656ANY0_VIBCL|nr:Uncharacterised protein [Vibrio cholerae]CSB92328.1 Uncharacterised protein [Vibrio cholerae]CSC24368.1 Uncharacterised protein [Vibrio cholerae]CSC28718.1 Uncharacterised protein [Vibrio cholerae]CSC69259.1 Uncharacterised protein [Vibrio cholerae]